ncbi:DNA methyltransferase 1-associated protein 1 [Chamberlinius hualienensis]
MSDVRDLLDRPASPDSSILSPTLDKKTKKKMMEMPYRKPEGMHRELYALLCSDNKDAPPLLPTDTGQGYKRVKAKLGMKRVRPWKWMTFTNPARDDDAVFHHWRRVADEGKEYPFAKFNKTVTIPSYTDVDYQKYLKSDSWNKTETDHLMDLCRRFDIRFYVIHDRWDRTQFAERSVEDLKERYYDICNILSKARVPPGQEPKLRMYDAEHERKRKEQLKRLFDRTPEQIEEEQNLMNELRKIEMRKREREKKTQDLQKLITAADSNTENRRQERKTTKKKTQPQKTTKVDTTTVEMTGIKFPDPRTSGVSVRSQRMKIPASVGQKKIKAVEQLLTELGIDLNPMPTDEICTHFNELRSDMVLLYELKLALANCEFELQTLRHQVEALHTGQEPTPS